MSECGRRLVTTHPPGAHLLAHLRDRCRRRAKLRPPVYQLEGRRARQQLERPVECRVAAAEDDEALTGELGGVLDAVLDGGPLEGLGALEADAPWLERAETGGDHDRAGIEGGAGGGAHMKAPVRPAAEFRDFLAEVQLRLERLDLLQQPVDQFLRPAHRQRRNVVDGLVRIELGALPARVRQGIHDVGADAEEAELEDLEQSAGTGADDDDFCGDRWPTGDAGGRLAQESGFRLAIAGGAL